MIGRVNANATTSAAAQGQSVDTIPARVHRGSQIEDDADDGFGASLLKGKLEHPCYFCCIWWLHLIFVEVFHF